MIRELENIYIYIIVKITLSKKFTDKTLILFVSIFKAKRLMNK